MCHFRVIHDSYFLPASAVKEHRVEMLILFRFCSEDYHPFIASKPKKYVVDDEYTPSWEVLNSCACAQ